MNKGYKQNEISQNYLKNKNSNLADRGKNILKDVAKKTGFIPQELHSRSAWWTSKAIGAFTYQGIYEGKKAILKIQGIKPNISEIYMIESFEKNNKSKIIRPPHLYAYLEWNNEARFEALILEDVGHERLINSPTNLEEIVIFFKIYEEYKKNCLKNTWVNKPLENLTEMTKNSFQSWEKISYDLYPNHPHRKNEDQTLVKNAVEILIKNYREIEPKFMHGHFSADDLIKVGSEIVLRSNLYWSWRNPFRDAVFAYHWFIYHLTSVPNITINQVDEQKNLWLDEIYKIPKSKFVLKLIKLALLERSAAGLNLDALSINQELNISEHIVLETRRDVENLNKELK